MKTKITDRMVQKYKGKTRPDKKIIRDTELTGFNMKISLKGTISFATEARIKGTGGSAKRRTIGKYPAFSVEQAREIAIHNLRMMQLGQDPAKVQKARIDTMKEADSWTLEKVFTEYKKRRDIKESTRRDYTYTINNVYGDWLPRPITEITRKMVEDRFFELESKSTAVKSSKILAALLSYTKGIELSNGERLITENVCEVFKDKRVDRKIARRQTVISPQELSRILGWLEGAIRHDERMRFNRWGLMAIYVIALTGCRRNEILRLKREDVKIAKDGKSRQGQHIDHFIIRDTKNRSDHIVPITREIEWIINMAMRTNKDSEWLFPSNIDTSKPINNTSVAVEHFLSGYKLHDCRRTFTSVAANLSIDFHSIKELVNHKSSDVTDGYIIITPEQRLPRLKKLYEMIQKEMMSHTPTVYELLGLPEPDQA